ncbi:DUF3572 domain-containing protein [Aureimonas leprariae]|uniref:DUF3572 family protein n=1 Tax=Plantimonas leprariae TaxID=2615207 RepID=A0A7V7PS74_9HYPH|nr:DUF3572 domain-containing protein [Aureimonas leprariae]KAB0681848.1 DUF3572 family protein [Aureimonas leprariae]
MLKNSRTRSPPVDENVALSIGIKALEFLAAEPELLSRFLSFSGLSVEQLRQEANRPAFFTGLLDFILAHEPTLEAFAAKMELRAEDVATAQRVLAGPEPRDVE